MYLFAFQCRFNKYGPSGSIQTHDALCVLPINIINEKIYIFLYFWFVFLGAVSAAWLLYRLLTIFSKDLRVNIIHFRSDRMVREIFSNLHQIFFIFIFISGPQRTNLRCSLQPEAFNHREVGRLSLTVFYHEECESFNYQGKATLLNMY